jgi:hypothetical protein
MEEREGKVHSFTFQASGFAKVSGFVKTSTRRVDGTRRRADWVQKLGIERFCIQGSVFRVLITGRRESLNLYILISRFAV